MNVIAEQALSLAHRSPHACRLFVECVVCGTLQNRSSSCQSVRHSPLLQVYVQPVALHEGVVYDEYCPI